MKSSNKILLSTFLLGLLMTLCAMIYAKNNMTITNRTTTIGDGIIETRELLAEYTSSSLHLGGHYIYTLDPSSTGVSLKADKNLIDVYRVSDNNGLSFYREGHQSINPSQKVEFVIGISGKTDLEINASDVSRVYSRKTINDNLTINAEDASRVEIEVNCAKLSADIKDASRISISGNCSSVVADVEDNSSLEVEGMVLDDLILDLEDTARYTGKSATNVMIRMKDKTIVNLEDKWESGTYKVKDLGLINIGDDEVIKAENSN